MNTNYITVDSFGSECPTNWEEIASALNSIIDDRGIADDRDACDDLWETYFRGELEDVPVPVMSDSVRTFGRDKTSLTLSKAARAVYNDSDPLTITEFDSCYGLRYNISGIIERSDLTADEVNEALEALGAE